MHRPHIAAPRHRQGRLRRLILPVALTLLLSVAITDLRAQSEDNPLDFAGIKHRIGLEIGFTSAWQSGSYAAGCGLFEKGAAPNLFIAAAYDRQLSSSLSFEALAGFQTRSVSSSYLSREIVPIATETESVRAEVDFENFGEANFSYLFLQPGMKFYPIPVLYVGGAAGVNFLTSASTQYRKDIVSRTVDLDRLGLAEVFYPESQSTDPYSLVNASESRDDATGVTIDGVIFVGGEFYLGEREGVGEPKKRRLAIGPRLQYTIPFVNALSDGERAMTLSSFQFLVGLRYDL